MQKWSKMSFWVLIVVALFAGVSYWHYEQSSSQNLMVSFQEKANCAQYLNSFTASTKEREDYELTKSSGTSENFWVAYSPKLNSCIGGYDVLGFDTNGRWKIFEIYNILTNTKIDALSYAYDDKVVDAGMSASDVVNKMNKEVSDLTQGSLANSFSSL